MISVSSTYLTEAHMMPIHTFHCWEVKHVSCIRPCTRPDFFNASSSYNDITFFFLNGCNHKPSDAIIKKENYCIYFWNVK